MTIQLELSTMKRRWVDESEAVLRPLLPNLITFTSDDLHHILNPPEHRNWYGVLVSRLKSKGIIKEVGRITSKRPESNARKISLWQSA